MFKDRIIALTVSLKKQKTDRMYDIRRNENSLQQELR